MTSANIHPNPHGWSAELRHQEGQAQRAASLLEQARLAVETEQPRELPGDKAQRIRGAAIVAQSAIAELLVTAGWLEAAQAAQEHGLIPEGTPEHSGE